MREDPVSRKQECSKNSDQEEICDTVRENPTPSSTTTRQSFGTPEDPWNRPKGRPKNRNGQPINNLRAGIKKKC
ncbi:hypothetical protein V6N11_029079 [Hibiscus sabdariffa]|uniref:Uncharacterized protein n=2 Tax=Hibiscus sabdariffa TaxID=183260 RepID=A0ABR1Z7D1_9ROSI